MTSIKITKTKNSKLQTTDFENLGFGKVFSDHMLICDYKNGSWGEPEIVPFQPMSLMPSAKIFHYGQSIFEGMKAYKDNASNTWLFRPIENYIRLNKSAKRLAIPEIPKNIFFDGLKELLKIDNNWIPNLDGCSLYIRPIVFATGEGFHASPADSYRFLIATAPSGPYFSGQVKVLIEEKYSRSANGGVGFAKAGGNYAGQFYPTQLAIEKGYNQVIWTDDNSHEYIEEAGAMNIFVRINDTLITGPTSDRILDGVTRKSIIDIANKEGIPVEIRKFKVSEIIEASKNNTLKEMFGAGTAAVISPISVFGFRNKDYKLPEIENSYATTLKKLITDIQTNKTNDKFGWRFLV
ncbi:MAG: branched-chain amino acid aminotransferase [Flavobacteriaceae bacterium]|jgi:branched-chain amino acid aminotransferase